MHKLICTFCCGLAVASGCQSADRVAGWRQVDEPPAKGASHETAPLAAMTAASAEGPGPRAQADAGELVRQGRFAIAQWYQTGSPEQLSVARRRFEDALRQDPHHWQAHHGLAIAADLDGNFPVAERHYQVALSRAPRDPDVLHDLGYSYLLQQRYAESERTLQLALQVQPTNPRVTKRLGDVLARQGRAEEARHYYAQVLPPTEVEFALAQSGVLQQAAPAQQPTAMASFPPVPAQSTVTDRPLNAPGAEAIAANAAGADRTLMQRLLPGKSREDEFGNEIKRRLDEQRSLQQQKAQAARSGVPALPDGELKRQLAAIDHEAYRGAGAGPMWIDHQTGRVESLGPALAGDGTAIHPGLGSAASPYGEESRVGAAIQPTAAHQATSNHRPAPQAWTGVEPAQATQPAPLTAEVAPAGYFTAPPTAWNGPMPVTNAAASPPGRQPWRGPEPHYSAAGPNSQMRYNGAHPVDLHAAAERATAAGVTADPRQTLPGSQTDPRSAADARAHPIDPFQNATRAAARMGMGLGADSPATNPQLAQNPGVPQLEAPGAAGMMHGDQFPAPQRYLPMDAPPRDLQQAYQPEPPLQAPLRQSHGAPIIETVAPNYSTQQFGTAARFDEQTQQTFGTPPASFADSQLQGYAAQRQQVSRELTQSMQHVWGQGPMVTPVYPAGGQAYEVPTFPGVSYTMQSTNTVQPAPWPHVQQTANHVVDPAANPYPYSPNPFPQAQRDPYQSSQNYPSQMVTPPPYRPESRPEISPQGHSMAPNGFSSQNRAATASANQPQSARDATSASGAGSPPPTGPGGLPAIVPGVR